MSENQAPAAQSALRTTLVGLIGNVLEWFDFAVYGYFSAEIAHAFFPKNDPFVAQLATFAVFAIGFFARPLGGLVLGNLGDRLGRRALLSLSIGLMGAATLGIGLLPGYVTIGVWAPALLILLRMIQGFSLGGEFTGSMVYTTEKADPSHRRGFVSSSTAAGTTLGFLLGILSSLLVNSALPKAEVVAWGWRIPFVASAIFCFLGLLLRRGITETEAGVKATAIRVPFLRSLAMDWKPILQTFGIIALTNAAYYLTFTFAVEKRKNLPGADPKLFLIATFITLSVVLFAKPFGGWISDLKGRRNVMLWLTALLMIAVGPATWFMLKGSPWVFLAGQALMAVPLGMALGLQGAMLVEIFPLRSRVSSMSFAYGVTLALTGGLMPFVSTWLTQAFRHDLAPAAWVMMFGLAGLAVLIPMKNTNDHPLDA